jgi:hypothetical protein
VQSLGAGEELSEYNIEGAKGGESAKVLAFDETVYSTIGFNVILFRSLMIAQWRGLEGWRVKRRFSLLLT